MSEWKDYTGSKEQIAEIKNNKNGYIVRNLNPYDAFILSSRIRYAFELWGDSMVNFEYLICNPHPLADMICQQARTGQPVWWRSIEGGATGLCYKFMPPFAHPDTFEYSFTEFKEEV